MISSQKIFVTGSSGFIGFHLCKSLLDQGCLVHGYDGMTDYYDVQLKENRLKILKKYPGFDFTEGMLEDNTLLNTHLLRFKPDIIVHLAAQAGVRYSLENPRAYIDSNIIGTFNVLDGALRGNVKHLLMASTSSVYGANTEMPFMEGDKTDTQLTIYAATKKANENMAHSYSHLHNIPITMFRFFTVYGPWGRPDMALFKFTKGILNKEPIDIYNNGQMYRDFTYVDDLVKSIILLIEKKPIKNENQHIQNDSLSPVAPYRVVNIGNSKKIKLLDFIEAIETELGIVAERNLMPMQIGDVIETWADATLLKDLTGFSPNTEVCLGISNFIKWYREYYNV